MEKVRYLMTKKELVRVHVIKSLIEDKMTSRDAAEVLSLSERQISRTPTGGLNNNCKRGKFCYQL